MNKILKILVVNCCFLLLVILSDVKNVSAIIVHLIKKIFNLKTVFWEKYSSCILDKKKYDLVLVFLFI